MNTLRRFRGYCPHPPLKNQDSSPLFREASWLSFQIRDFASSFDGLVGFAALYGLLFAASFITLPDTGVAGQYQLALLRVGLAVVASLTLVYIYARLRGITFFNSVISNAQWSLLESFLAVLLWGGIWFCFGIISNSYFVGFDSGRLATAPLALLVGFLGSLIVHGFCAPKFQYGVGDLPGVIVSSSAGALLFFAVSMDYPFSFLPLIVLLVLVEMRTNSPIGPIIFTTLLFGLFWVWPATQTFRGVFQPTYGSTIAAVLAGFFVFKILRPRRS